MDTKPGFYKLENNELFYGLNFVINASYHLIKEDKNSYDYPTDGWYWFDAEVEARSFFGLPPVIEHNPTPYMNL